MNGVLLAAETLDDPGLYPLFVLAVGIITVLGMIIALKINAFIALISAAIVVSLMAPGEWGIKISRVAEAFGSTAGKIGIVIAFAAVIGKCMMDSGAADRIVRSFLNLLGEKRAPHALMGSGFVLAVPVFFDTVFYLLVPLARSLYRRTNKNYLMYILAIGAGGAITHTLVPPTPGPLVMAAYLGIDIGTMMLIGALVALPSAFAGVIYAKIADSKMNIPMRSIEDEPEEEPFDESQLPSLWLSLLPIVLPVFMISTKTVVDTFAKPERVEIAKVVSKLEVSEELETFAPGLSKEVSQVTEKTVVALRIRLKALTETIQKSKTAPAGLADQVSSLSEPMEKGTWEKNQSVTDIIGNPSFALLISMTVALLLLYKERKPTLVQMSQLVEISLMSGGVIILITAAGGAFGAMLEQAEIGKAIQNIFQEEKEEGEGEGQVEETEETNEEGTITENKELGVTMLFLGFGVAMLLKIAQGSSTVAMITASSMLAAMIDPNISLGFNKVYLATAIGAGSCVGSWMNDSGFWIFAKMGGLTEVETLKSWTPMLAVLGIVSMLTTLLLALVVLPMKPDVPAQDEDEKTEQTSRIEMHSPADVEDLRFQVVGHS